MKDNQSHVTNGIRHILSSLVSQTWRKYSYCP